MESTHSYHCFCQVGGLFNRTARGWRQSGGPFPLLSVDASRLSKSVSSAAISIRALNASRFRALRSVSRIAKSDLLGVGAAKASSAKHRHVSKENEGRISCGGTKDGNRLTWSRIYVYRHDETKP